MRLNSLPMPVPRNWALKCLCTVLCVTAFPEDVIGAASWVVKVDFGGGVCSRADGFIPRPAGRASIFHVRILVSMFWQRFYAIFPRYAPGRLRGVKRGPITSTTRSAAIECCGIMERILRPGAMLFGCWKMPWGGRSPITTFSPSAPRIRSAKTVIPDPGGWWVG